MTVSGCRAGWLKCNTSDVCVQIAFSRLGLKSWKKKDDVAVAEHTNKHPERDQKERRGKWRRDAPRFSVSCSRLKEVGPTDWWTDWDIRRSGLDWHSTALWPRTWCFSSCISRAEFCHVDQRGIDHHTLKAYPCCVWTRAEEEQMRQIKRNFWVDSQTCALLSCRGTSCASLEQ